MRSFCQMSRCQSNQHTQAKLQYYVYDDERYARPGLEGDL